MRRRLSTPFSTLSLLSCVLFCGLWACSYAAVAAVGRQSWAVAGSPVISMSEVAIVSTRGRLVIGTESRQFPGGSVADAPRRSASWVAGPDSFVGQAVRHRPWYGPLGFEFGFSRTAPGSARDWALYVPFWFLCLLTALPPARCFALSLLAARRLRRQMNLCPHCGYDMRATPARCPECGMARVSR